MAGISGPEPRLDPWTLNLDRTLRPSRRVYLVEERDGSGAWVDRGRFGAYAEATAAFDRLSTGSERSFRIRKLSLRRWLTLLAAIAGGIVVLAVVSALVYILAG
jgi:hypothetical protein